MLPETLPRPLSVGRFDPCAPGRGERMRWIGPSVLSLILAGCVGTSQPSGGTPVDSDSDVPPDTDPVLDTDVPPDTDPVLDTDVPPDTDGDSAPPDTDVADSDTDVPDTDVVDTDIVDTDWDTDDNDTDLTDDFDHDGFIDLVDCDDHSAWVYPGKVITSDDVWHPADNDCDGFFECATDLDGDGAAGVLHDDAPISCADSGQSDAFLDCDEADPGRRMGIPENPCDEYDADCGGESEEIVPGGGDVSAAIENASYGGYVCLIGTESYPAIDVALDAAVVNVFGNGADVDLDPGTSIALDGALLGLIDLDFTGTGVTTGDWMSITNYGSVNLFNVRIDDFEGDTLIHADLGHVTATHLYVENAITTDRLIDLSGGSFWMDDLWIKDSDAQGSALAIADAYFGIDNVYFESVQSTTESPVWVSDASGDFETLDAADVRGQHGGFLHVDDASDVTISGSLVEDSSALKGGVLYVAGGSTIDVQYAVWTDSLAYVSGGSIENQGGAVSATNSFVVDTSAPLGGAVHQTGGSLSFLNVSFSENVSVLGGLFNGEGGAITVHNTLMLWTGCPADGGGTHHAASILNNVTYTSQYSGAVGYSSCAGLQEGTTTLAVPAVNIPGPASGTVWGVYLWSPWSTFPTPTSVLRNGGDPSILDGDGSRSDIGGLGGPAGTPTIFADTDNDGLPNAWETEFGYNPNSSASPGMADSDGDMMLATSELAAGTSPYAMDTDGDGHSDSYEFLVVHTDPNQSDTDLDGCPDSQDAHPLDYTSC